MGGTLSVCGLGPSAGDHDPQLQYQSSRDFTQSFERPAKERGRSLSSTTDCSVASILSNSEQLIPDAFMPKDIQVLSQRRQRLGHSHLRSSLGQYSTSTGSSKVSNLSSSRGTGTVRVVRNRNATDKIPASVNKRFNFGIKTASSSFGYSDDDEVNNPSAAVDNSSGRLLRVK